MDLLKTIIQKNLIFPKIDSPLGHKNKKLVTQLNAALRENGFSLSEELVEFLSQLKKDVLIRNSQTILDAIKTLIGSHVKHNVYFIDFPNNVPDTKEFWTDLLDKYISDTGGITFNLLDFPEYGKYQHTYEEMLAKRSKKIPSGVKYKVINLGKTYSEELTNLYISLAGSRLPLNDDDKKVLVNLLKNNHYHECLVPVRENKAFINEYFLSNNLPLQIDTVTDILRLACQISKGDVSLNTPTKFISFNRHTRFIFLKYLDKIIKQNIFKIDDANNYKEQFKRLARNIHPFEYPFTHAQKLFKFVSGDSKHKTFNSKVSKAIQKGDTIEAAELLSIKPGQLFRSLDKILRDSPLREQRKVLTLLKQASVNVSNKVLLSVYEHLLNRLEKHDKRIFFNKNSKSYIIDDNLKLLRKSAVENIRDFIFEKYYNTFKYKNYSIEILDGLEKVAVPLSEKTKSSGFNVLPRGSEVVLEDKKVLRFFTYWKQRKERTDYDLSCIFFDKDFNYVTQVSWTQLRDTRFSLFHSGDITQAQNGASEFIDIDLNSLKDISYIVPAIYNFIGETFEEVKESFFGYMTRNDSGKNAPFDPLTVNTKFDLRGSGKIAHPVVFFKQDNNWVAKSLDIYGTGYIWGNRIEYNKFSTALLMKTITQRKYLTLDQLFKSDGRKKKRIYIGLTEPTQMSGDNLFFNMNNLKDFVYAEKEKQIAATKK